jgi:hypothetical protein
MEKVVVKDLSEYILSNFEDVYEIDSWGEKSYFYNPGKVKPRGSYFCTMKEKDGDNDKASGLDREDVFRFNFGVSKEVFKELFSEIPARPGKGGIIEGLYNFTEIDILTPHPIYGWMCWIAILNPSQESFNSLQSLLKESYGRIKKKHDAKI